MSATDHLILNIDDQQAIRYAKTRALQRAGFKVMEASSGTEGLDCVKNYRPALVMCDVRMPDMSGYEVCRQIKQNFPGTLVMQVSASFITGQDRAVGLDYGADTYLTEPIEPEELVASVRALLRLKEYEREIQATNSRHEFVYTLAERQRALDDAGEIMRVSAEAIARRLKVQRAGFHEYLGQDAIAISACWTAGVFPVLEGDLPTAPLGEDRLTAYRAGQTIVRADTPDTVEPSLRLAVIDVPILRWEQWRATMFLHDNPGRGWKADEIAIAQEVAQLTWDAVERARATKRLVQLNQSLEERVEERTKTLLSTEAQLRQAQKMEAVGQLTGGIAHDFNNLLTGIIGGIRIVRRRLDQGRADEIGKFMNEVTNSAERAAALVHRLLAFSRRQSLDFKVVDIGVLVNGVEDLLQRTVGEGIILHTEFPKDLWEADTDSAQLETALLNLAINARDAMPDGGQLTITAENTVSDGTDFEKGDYILIRVRDTGTGIPEDVIERVFDPFFTTKPIGQGTGLGLSMVYGFMKQSRGHVEILSTVGKGTEIRLYLCRSKEVDEGQSQQNVEEAVNHSGSGRILLVEDNTAVQLLMREHLAELGYEITCANDGNEAVILLSSDRIFDLLVTDVGLPGVNGRQVAEVARESRPEIKIIFITGYAETARIRAGFLPKGAGFITKPFEMDALAAKVSKMLKR